MQERLDGLLGINNNFYLVTTICKVIRICVVVKSIRQTLNSYALAADDGEMKTIVQQIACRILAALKSLYLLLNSANPKVFRFRLP
jgi:hypothetical protein